MGSEPLFPLHHRWEVMPLGEVCRRGGGNVQTGPFGSQLHASDYVSDGIPSVMPQNIGDNKILYTGIAKITREDAERLSKYRMREGDIVYSRRGDVERRALVRKTEDGWLCGTGCLRIRFGDEFVYPRYAAHYLGHPSVREWIVRHAHGATMPNLNTTILSELPFVLPPWSAQVLIGDAIEAYDRKLDLNRRINQTLEAMAQAIFQSWFVDFDPVKAKIAAKAEGRDPLRAAMTAVSGKADAELDALPPEQYEQLAATAALFPDEMEESEVGEVPKGWSVGTLSNFASFQNGYAFKTKDWTDSGHPVVKIGNVKPGIIDLSGCSLVAHETVNGLDRFALKKGDLLVGMTGYVGETGLVPALYSVAYLNQRVGRISTVNGVSDIGYPFCLVRDPAYKAYAESKAHGSAQANVSGKDLMDYQAVVPDAGVLKIFNAQVAKIINALLSYHEENQSLAALRDTLLPRLLSGELLVADAMAEAVA